MNMYYFNKQEEVIFLLYLFTQLICIHCRTVRNEDKNLHLKSTTQRQPDLSFGSISFQTFLCKQISNLFYRNGTLYYILFCNLIQRKEKIEIAGLNTQKFISLKRRENRWQLKRIGNWLKQKFFSSCGSAQRRCQCVWRAERGSKGIQTEIQVRGHERRCGDQLQ